ncbi:MAG: hypothetical protein XU14_C0017G0002 [Armatimonadetes bacterium CSP1-3]|nr:MAG: hypothetical protein XU14_C0017G0002 [Armatimonadetes bacterium CSP1-3]
MRPTRQLPTMISTALSYTRSVRKLSVFLAKPLGSDECLELTRHRLQTREPRFLESMRRLVYAIPTSPYMRLLQLAGCEYRDLELMISQRGLERTLEALYQAGVYLSFEELVGTKEVFRGTHAVPFTFRDLDHPLLLGPLHDRSSGSRSRGRPVSISFEDLAERDAPTRFWAMEALGASAMLPIIWRSGFPVGGLLHWLSLARLRRPPVRWFSTSSPEYAYGGKSRHLIAAARLLARRQGWWLPAPEFITLSQADIVLDAVLEASRRQAGCIVITKPSFAVRLAALARQRGVSLHRVCFETANEPLTPGKAEEIRASGARVGSIYGFHEGGMVGVPCGHPVEPDDMHFVADCYGLIQRTREYAGVPMRSFMFTTLLASARKILLNVEIDDFGLFEPRRCGCPLDDLGFRYHLANVRSFTKLTGEGVTVVGTNCVHIIEEVLPKTFGGQSIDYQLLEVEDQDHLTRLLLLVSPRLGPLDEQAVRTRFISTLDAQERGGIPLWRQAETIQVVRQDPVHTAGGKLFPFHTIALSEWQKVVERPGAFTIRA